MSFLKQILDEAVQAEMDFEDDLEKMAEKLSGELIETAIQVMQEMIEDEPEEGMELDAGTIADHAIGFLDMFDDDVKRFIERDAQKYYDAIEDK